MTAVFTDTTLAPVPRLEGVPTVAVLGMGYVGLPTSLALREAGFPVLGVDISERRLDDIRTGAVDLLDRDRPRLAEAMDSGLLALTADSAALAEADAVIIAVPTPVDRDLNPDLKMALLLRDVAGLPYNEIADSLEITLATVKWRIFKAREEVQQALAREGILSDEPAAVASQGAE